MSNQLNPQAQPTQIIDAQPSAEIVPLREPLSTALPDRQLLNDAVERAIAANLAPAEINQLRYILEKFPNLYRDLGDVAATSRVDLAYSISRDLLTRESILLYAEELRDSLARPTDTPLENILIEQCINAYLAHYDVEIQFTRFGIKSHPNTWDHRVESSQRRFLRALDALARLRQLALPALQINIAETQTNLITKSS